MNKNELYKKFRYGLDDYAIPLILENMEYIELKHQDKIVGFACLYGDYVDAFYILPKYRRKNIGSKLVKELYKEYKFKTLHIINSNIPAINFWKKNFKLRKLEINFCDTLYEIIEEENKND